MEVLSRFFKEQVKTPFNNSKRALKMTTSVAHEITTQAKMPASQNNVNFVQNAIWQHRKWFSKSFHLVQVLQRTLPGSVPQRRKKSDRLFQQLGRISILQNFAVANDQNSVVADDRRDPVRHGDHRTMTQQF